MAERHIHIPNCIVKNFYMDGGSLYMMDCKSDSIERTVKTKEPFTKTNFYDDDVEKKLSLIERGFGQAYKEIEKHLEGNKNFELNKRHKNALLKFIIVLIRRHHFEIEELGKEKIAHKEVQKRVKNIIDETEIMIENREVDSRLFILKCIDGEFITSLSGCVYKSFDNGGPGIFLPVTPKNAIYVAACQKSLDSNRVEILCCSKRPTLDFCAMLYNIELSYNRGFVIAHSEDAIERIRNLNSKATSPHKNTNLYKKLSGYRASQWIYNIAAQYMEKVPTDKGRREIDPRLNINFKIERSI